MRRYHVLMVVVAIMLTLSLFLTLAHSNVITYGNQAPTASFTYSPDIPTPNEIISFNASASYDSDGWIVRYSWDFGDGNVTSVTNPIITHSYPLDGTYTVELTVTDDSDLTGTSAAVVEVSTVTFFRVSFMGTLTPISNVTVTAYYNNGSAWVKAPVGSNGFEIKYDKMTEPNLANTNEQRYRNPGYTASTLRQNASNIGFDLHPSCWTVFFKFEWNTYVAYWPNETTRVYSYKKGVVETHDYLSGHQAYWNDAASTYVIRVGDIPGAGVSPTESHPIIVGLSCPPPQKNYLTVRTDPAGITTIPGEGWYAKNTNVTLTAPTYVNTSATTRYRFTYWDVDGTSQGSGINPITVFMNANHTATAHYVIQYTVVFNHTGLSSDATGTIVTVNGGAKTFADLPYTLWVDSGGSVTYSYSSPVSSSVSGKRFRLNSVSGPTSPITVSGPVTVTGNYVTQYLVTFAQTGLDSTAIGTVVTVNGSAKTYSGLPFNWWVDCGATVTYSYSSTVSSSVTDKQFMLTGVNCPPSQFVVTGPVTITGSYCIQYKVTFQQTGLDSTATGTVVIVNGTSKTYSQLPYSFWVDSGSSVTYSYSSTVSSSYSDKRFRLSSVTGSTSPITVTAPTTVTGNYIIQYQITFAQTGLDSTATGTVVTVNGAAKTFTDLPYTSWIDNGGSITYSYSTTVSSSTSGKRFRLNTVSGPTSPITISGTTTVTGNYVTQYLITFAQTGLDSTATGTVVTANGNAKTFADLPYTLWVDSGGSVTYSYSSTVSSSVSGKQFRLNTVSGPASPITVTGSTTVTGNYVTQYMVTFTQTGLDSTATGTVVTVNGNAKGLSDLPFALWVDSGSSVTYSYSNVSSSTTGKRFILTAVSGSSSPITVTSSVTVTGNYKTQYKVRFDQSGVGSDFVGTVVTVDSVNYNVAGLPVDFWWDQSTNHNFAFASPLTVNASKQYAWSSTSGLSTLQSGTLTISASGSVTGNYIVQNCVTFDQVGASSDFTSTVVTVDGSPYGVGALSVSFYWQLGTVHSFAFQSPLVVTANGKQYVWTSTSGLSTLQSGSINVTSFGSIIGHYKTQYYLNVTTSPSGLGSPSGSGWYDDGTYVSISAEQYLPGGSRWRFAGWTTGDMSEITSPSSPSTTVLVDMGKTVTANYVHQYLITFGQTGLASDASGTVVTVNSTALTYSGLPYSVWVDVGEIINYSYEATVSSTMSGKQFSLTGVTGSSSPITVNADTNVTGNYKTQFYLTVTSPYGVTGGQGWYDSGATAYATLNTGTIDHGNGTRHAFTNWNGDASGTNYAQSNPITMNAAKTALAQWKTQHCVTFTHSGLDSSATGTVVTVNNVSVSFGQLPYNVWVDNGSPGTYSYGNVSSSTSGKKFVLTGVSGPSSPITVTEPTTITGNYKTQYQVTFSQTGVSSDFTGTIVTIDGTDYSYATLSANFWWDSGSSHAFSFVSPLIVNISRQYNWTSTTGLSTLQTGTLTITTSGSVTGNYVAQTKYQVAFDKTGISGDFDDTIVIIDGTSYNRLQLPALFWWDFGSVHTFAYLSPREVTPNIKQYVWTSTTGLSTEQNASLTITTSGSVIGNYKTQYYLTLTTDPLGITTPSGEGWYDAGTNATISTVGFVETVPNSTRYRFYGWTTANMSEIEDYHRTPTGVIMDEGKTVTALYWRQSWITFDQTGVDPNFTGTVVTVDGTSYNVTTLPVSFWWDAGSWVHTFAYSSPLVITPNAKQNVWVSTTGLSDKQSDTISINASGTITGNYKTQYYLAVHSLYDSPTPPSGYFDAGTSITASITSPSTGPTGTRYTCIGWTGGGSVPPSGTGTSVVFTIDEPSSINWNWKTQYYLTVKTNPTGIATISGEGWYDETASVTLTAPTVQNYTFSYWDVDSLSRGNGVNPISVLMDAPHTATAHYTSLPNPLSVSINPPSTTIILGASVFFTSTVNGGTGPYAYQWYLGSNPVAGATSNTWVFTPTAGGTYFISLKVTDIYNNTAQSNSARVTVTSGPIGGYAISLTSQIPATHLAAYLALVTLFAAMLTLTKRKRK